MSVRSRALILAATTLLVATMARADWPHLPGSSQWIQGGSGGQWSPASAPDGDEGAFVVWDDNRSGTTQAYVQRLDRWGRSLWTSGGVRAIPGAPHSFSAHVTSDGRGGCLVICGGGTDLLVQRFGPSGAPLWGANGMVVTSVSGAQPRVLADGSGGGFVAWSDFRGANYDIYAQRITSGGAMAWVAGGVPVCAAAGDQFNVRLVGDGRGGVVAAWQDYRAGFGDVYAQRVDATGNGIWTPDGESVAGFSATRFFRDGFAPDDEGGAIFAWAENRDGSQDIWTQRIDGEGSRLWGANGLRPCVSSATRFDAVATSDGTGGAIIAYADSRFPPNVGTYAQKLGPEGTPQWTTDGVYLSSASWTQREQVIVGDGNGGAIVAWRDVRAYPAVRIYARRIDASGVPAWSSDGVNLGVAGFETWPPSVVVSDRGAITVWHTNRGTGLSVYGQRVDAYGNLGAPEPRLVSVADVPNDQGGRVKVSWNASWLDLDPSWQVNYYTVLRSVPAFAATKRLAAGERAITSGEGAPQDGMMWTTRTASQDVYWEPIGSVSATHYVSGYSYLAPTAGDSVAGVNPRTAFMVVAQNFSGQFWRSAADSGYSVDDLAPAPPAPFTGNYGFGTMRLHWDPNAESDLSGYRLYRGDTPGFVPGPGNLIAAPADTGYADVAYARYHYKLTAVDVHGNESPVATFSPSGTVGVDDVPTGALSFAAPTPNPARGATTLRFTLPTAGAATLEVYDASGRRVRTLHAGEAVAGAHAVTFDLRDGEGRALPPGLYLARLEAGGRSLTRRLVIAH